MPSVIPGYEYDVFVSYRQKDNKHDGWVTEFVTNLKKELEVTFKEDISVYFDENLLDGIREGHEINDSLNAKLKCVIFIPIISQTYCDPKSYAWNNEFLPFKQTASADQFGLKVKLKNGNVSSRIIPVRIHEPDVQDSLLLVREIGGALRPIDFIFQSPGVNRPLRADEDHPQDNRNKFYYRDQINKVANLIKDIVIAVQSPGRSDEHSKPPRENFVKDKSRNRFVWIIAIVAALVTAFLFYRMDFNSDSSTAPTTIAVIPFKVIGGEDESRYFADGVMDVIRSNLSMFPELKVKSRTSMEQYRDSPKTIPEIARELDVLFVLEGSAQKLGDDIRVIVQLIDTRTDVNVWSEKFDRKFDHVFEIENQISEAIAQSLKARLTSDIAHRIKRTPTNNFETYDLFLRAKQASRDYSLSGNVEHLNKAIILLQQSLVKDARFALGYAWLAALKSLRNSGSISGKASQDSIFMLAKKALALDSTLVEAQIVLSEIHYANLDDVNALHYTYQAMMNEGIDSASVSDLMKRLGSIYSRIGDTDRALYFFDKILRFSPQDKDVMQLKFYSLAADHRVGELRKLSEKIKKADPEDPFVNFIQAHIGLERNDDVETAEACARIHQSDNSGDLKGQFDLIYALTLHKRGKEKESLEIAMSCKDQFKDDPYFNAQISLYNGENTKALEQLKLEEVGWYNINLCDINPIFDRVRSNPLFIEFLAKNKSRISGLRERIHQLENQGYLPKPDLTK